MKSLVLIFLFVLTSLTAFSKSKLKNPWSENIKPTSSRSESIGEYTAGCLRGAQQLTTDGPGFQVMRLSRNRFYGHPSLLYFIQELSLKVHSQTGQDILVGDLGQPRGGPTLTGHASHQTGLDADVWLWQPPKAKVLTLQERETLSAPSMVIPEFEGLTQNWGDHQPLMLKAAAELQDVERIFVNPVIKRAMCVKYPGALWLRKLRPWWFHESHFHVRLKCQFQSPSCVNQNPPPEGDGCGEELASWFTQESKDKSYYMRTHPTPAVMPALPQACQSVLSEP